MSYNRIAKPRFYMDTPNWKISRGDNISGWSLLAGGGSAVTDLIDMKPLNRCSFDTSENPTTHIVLQWDTGVTSTADKFDYVAILNHNLKEAEGKIRVAYKATPFSGNAGDGTSVTNMTEVVNGTVSGNVATPSYNGSTIVTFDEVTANDGRYWAIEIEDDSNFSATDLEIGSIMLGEYYDMPHSPDLSIKRDFEYDGVTLHQSLGGGEYSTATHFGGDDFDSNFGQPFRQRTTTSFRRTGGRMSYDMKFSYLNDTNLMPSDLSAPWGDSVFHDVWNKTSGRFNPFIFAVDGTSNIMGDYIFARFNQDSFNATQVAPQVWDMSVKIRETW